MGPPGNWGVPILGQPHMSPMQMRLGTAAASLLALATVACSDDTTTPVDTTAFGGVASALAAQDCRSCHNATNSLFHGGFNLAGNRAADSAEIENFLDFEAPSLSPLVQRPLLTAATEHPVRAWNSLADSVPARLIAYASALGALGRSRTLTALRVTAPPLVDGVADASWASVPSLDIPVSGGFAGNRVITMRAAYVPGDRVYFLVQWDDPTESIERAPWVKTVTGWLHEAVAPSSFNNAYLANWTQPPAEYRYEDKLAIIWNTTGASAIAGFNTNGCAVLCHVGAIGDARPLKYTNGPGETGDMWHWKLVRTNVVHRLDDQLVYWNRDLALNSGAGRRGDPGGGEYTGNSTLDTLPGGAVIPRFTSANQPAAPYYLVDSATAAAWAAAAPGWTIDPGDVATRNTADPYAVGDRLAYAITTLKPNVDRSDVEAYGVWAGGRWTLEISRSLTTTSAGMTLPGYATPVPVDVQFVPGETYHFGIAIFENAQIEHSWSRGAVRLRFQP